MRCLFSPILVFCVLIIGSCKQDKKYHDIAQEQQEMPKTDALKEVLSFQKKLNEEFKDPKTSPLADRHRKDFLSLDFFKPDTNYRVVAEFSLTPDALPFLMPTTTERKSKEKVFGIARFFLNGKWHQLEVYQDQELMLDSKYEKYLFLPFTDQTNGDETYGGGRYIDLSIPEGDSLIIDFNKAYNPYCAYNPKFSCPIVPKVNHLDIAVMSGVKAFKK